MGEGMAHQLPGFALEQHVEAAAEPSSPKLVDRQPVWQPPAINWLLRGDRRGDHVKAVGHSSR